jgi:hypothetical protein
MFKAVRSWLEIGDDQAAHAILPRSISRRRTPIPRHAEIVEIAAIRACVMV